jgi:hypothetical protein
VIDEKDLCGDIRSSFYVYLFVVFPARRDVVVVNLFYG